MQIPDSNIGVSTVTHEIECQNTPLWATVELFSRSGRRLGVLSNITLVDARVNANALVESTGIGAFAVIRAPGVEEVMRWDDCWHSGFTYFPLADLTRLPRVPHTPADRLARHFQMAGTVDQARVERLASIMRAAHREGLPPGFVGRTVKFYHDFVTHPSI